MIIWDCYSVKLYYLVLSKWTAWCYPCIMEQLWQPLCALAGKSLKWIYLKIYNRSMLSHEIWQLFIHHGHNFRICNALLWSQFWIIVLVLTLGNSNTIVDAEKMSLLATCCPLVFRTGQYIMMCKGEDLCTLNKWERNSLMSPLTALYKSDCHQNS